MKNLFQLLSLTISIVVCSCSIANSNSSTHDSDFSSFSSSLDERTASTMPSSSSESLPSDEITSSLDSSLIEPLTFTVTWLNDDGSVLEVDESVIEGSIPSYDGDIPQKENDDKYTYYFDGWDKEIVPIYSNTVYVAKYSNELVTYSVTWVIDDTIRVDRCKYGDLPCYDEIEECYFIDNARRMYFVGWDKEIEPVTKDATYTALFSVDEPSTYPLNSPFVCYFIAGSDDKACYIGGYKGGKEEVVIPDFYKGVPIESIHSLGNSDMVKSIYIGKYVKEIKASAFGELKYLEKITVDEDNSYYSSNRGVLYDKGFTTLIRCPSCYLGRLDLPKTILTISDGAFRYINGLTSIIIPDLVSSSLDIHSELPMDIDIHCALDVWLRLKKSKQLNCRFHLFLDGNTKETKSITIPNGVMTIDDFAFYNCISLTSVIIPNSVHTIGKYAFCQCRSLSFIKIPNSVVTIDDFAFRGCHSITSFIVPDGVTTIGNEAFSFCISITSLVVSSTVTSIGDNAFQYCTSLTSISFLTDCSNFDLTQLISTMDKIKEIHVSDSDSAYMTVDNVLFSKDCRTLIRCSTEKSGEFIIPNSVTSIANHAFAYCRLLTSIVIPDSVTSIGDNTFYFCNLLSSIIIPNSVTSIGNYAFFQCYSLTSIVIPDSVTYVGYSAFSGCNSLESFSSFADSSSFNLLEVIKSLSNLKVINVSDDDTLYKSIDGVLYSKDAKSLVGYPRKGSAFFEIPNGVTSIGEAAFHSCSSLTSIVIPNSVTTIGDLAFVFCSSLESIVIPDSVVSINDSAFKDCKSLTSVILNDNIQCIGANAFNGCTSLKEISIPDSVKFIGSYAFSNCSNLEKAIINGSIYCLSSYTFGQCLNLKYVVLPNSIVQIESNAFWKCNSLEAIYYLGTAEQWNNIFLCEKNKDLSSLVYYYLEGEPIAGGNYWHYVDEEPVIWN